MSSPENITGLVPKSTGLQGPEVVPKSRISIDTGLWDHPGPTPLDHRTILLSEAASKHLLEAGECFAICGKSSNPDYAGRIVLHLVSIPMKQASDACEVAMGIRKAGKRITPSKP